MERLAGWLWTRQRAQYMTSVVIALGLVSAMNYVPLVALVVGVFFGARVGVVAASTTFIVNTTMFPMIFLWPSTELAHLRAWIEGDHSNPTASLQATFSYTRGALRRGVPMMSCAYIVVLTPLQAWLGDLTAPQTAVMAMFNMAGVLTNISLFRAAGDLFMRPIRADIAERLEGSPVDLRRTATVASRLGWVGFSFATVVGIATAAVVIQFDSSVAQFAATIAASVGTALVLGRMFWHPLALAPNVRPIADLTATARRIGGGDYSQALEVTSDDDLGELVEAVNDMQRGLTQREQLRSAFGTYVDPALAERLLEQGDDTFQGERIDVTVLFVDIREFTPFAEANTAEDTVAHLNAVFEIVVPVVADQGGHVNKFLGDGAMAVFGAPLRLEEHADAAVLAAVEMQHRVHERFGDSLRIGIGVNSGAVIAGTIGGGGKLEFTLIGDTVNVAARVETATKATGDQIMLTTGTVGALTAVPDGLIERGGHILRGKSESIDLFALNPVMRSPHTSTHSTRPRPKAFGRSDAAG